MEISSTAEVPCDDCTFGAQEVEHALCAKHFDDQLESSFEDGKAEGLIEGRDEAEVKCKEQHG